MAHLAAPSPSSLFPVETRAGLESQLLWQLGRPNSPSITAVMTVLDGRVFLDVAFGRVAHQRVGFPSSLAAVKRAEGLRGRLEASGYRRRRPDRRRER